MEGNIVGEWREYYKLLTAAGEELDALQFWKKHSCTLPELFDLAKKFLCIPISSASLDRRCSMVRRILTAQRSHISAQSFSLGMFNAGNSEFLEKYRSSLLTFCDDAKNDFPLSDEEWLKGPKPPLESAGAVKIPLKRLDNSMNTVHVSHTTTASSSSESSVSASSNTEPSSAVLIRIPLAKLAK